MFLIPIIIILGILAFSFAGDIVKNLDFIIPSFFSVGQTSPAEKEKEEPKAPAPQRTSPSPPQPPRPPPIAPTPLPQQPPSTNSPYFQKVRISGVQATNGTRPALITLRSNIQDNSVVSITGWRIKSTWSGEFTIPNAFQFYHPSLSLPPQEPILLNKTAAVVYLKGEPSPLGRSAHFRTNTCFPYLKIYYPALPGSSSCSQTRPKLEDTKHLPPLCQEFILHRINYGSCIAPDYSKDPAVATNTDCINFINTQGVFTYEACFQKHSAEQNFLSSEWYVYIDTAFGHPLHDAVSLYDQNGLLVDTYLY